MRTCVCKQACPCIRFVLASVNTDAGRCRDQYVQPPVPVNDYILMFVVQYKILNQYEKVYYVLESERNPGIQNRRFLVSHRMGTMRNGQIDVSKPGSDVIIPLLETYQPETSRMLWFAFRLPTRKGCPPQCGSVRSRKVKP